MSEPLNLSTPNKTDRVLVSAQKDKMCRLGVDIAKRTFISEFTPFVKESKTLTKVADSIEILPHDRFVDGFPIRVPGDEDTIGYRTIKGKVTLDGDRMLSSDHAFQVTYHELLEEASAKMGTNLRSFHKLHEGIIQYFVRKITEEQKKQYYLSAYEERADIIKKLIEKGVPEELWKQALVDNQKITELVQTVDRVLGHEQGFREIDWALDNDDRSKIEKLLS